MAHTAVRITREQNDLKGQTGTAHSCAYTILRSKVKVTRLHKVRHKVRHNTYFIPEGRYSTSLSDRVHGRHGGTTLVRAIALLYFCVYSWRFLKAG